jgi:hypothetical protein
MNNTLANGFSDIEVPVVSGGTNDSTTLSLTFNGEDQGAKGTITPDGTAGAITAWVKVNDASRDETFRLRPRITGYKALPAAITIDGVTVQPSIRLEGEDATVSAWTDVINGTSFAIAGTGADPTFDEQAPGIDCKRVKFNAGKYYAVGSSGVGALSTNDFVIEAVVKHDTSAVNYIFSKVGPAGLGESVVLYSAGGSLVLYVDSELAAADQVTLSTSMVNGLWYHIMLFCDRNGNGKGFVNGAGGTAVSIANHSAANLAENGRWSIGADTGGSGLGQVSTSYFALWHRASWLATADCAGIAAKRFAQCCGTYAETAQLVNPGFLDLDMEAADAASWTALNTATLSKQSGTRTGGSGSLVIRVAGDGSTSSPKAAQTRAGGITRVTGWARSNGAAVPTVALTSTTIWTGSNSTSWQAFDIAVSSYLYASTRLELGTALATGHVEFDDVTIEADGAIPTTQSRSTQAYLEKWNIAGTESYLIPVGANWLRTDKIKCADGTFEIGARLEQAQTNLFLYSEDFSNAAWTKTRTTIGTVVTGLGSLSFNPIIASVDNATHLIKQAVVTAAGEEHVVTVYAKAGGGVTNSIRIELNEDATQYAYYNLATGEIGAVGAGFTLTAPAHIYPKGNGYYRCDFRPTTPGTAATVNIYLSNGSTAGSETFTGDGTTVGVYLAGAQFERQLASSQHTGSPSSYVKTTSATVTRVKDLALYHGYENCGGLNTKNVHMKVDHVCLAFANNYVGLRTAGSLTSKSANDRSELYSDMSTKKWNAIAVTGGTTQASLAATTSTPFDNNLQTTEACFAKDNVALAVSKTVEARDTSATINPMTEIVVGASTGYLYHIDGIITDFLLSPYGTEYPRAIFALDKDAYTQQAFIGYDMLDEDALTYELRAGGGTTRLVTMNGGTFNVGTWYLISLEWTGGTSVRIRVNGTSVDSATADATIAELTDLFIAWAGLYGYTYEPAAGDPDYPITYGAISIADVQHHTAVPPAAWYTEMVARGVPAKNEHLIHQISQVAHQAETHYDLLTGTEGAITDSGSVLNFVPPTEVGLALGASSTNKTIIDFGTNFAFMQETSHSYDAWIRVDGSGDQCVWANGDANTTDFQALLYDNATDSLIYKCVIGATLRSVSAEIELDRLYHVTITRDYDSGAGTTTIAIYLDAVAADIQIYSGAPVVTNDDFVMLSTLVTTSESGEAFTLPFTGATVGNRFYDDALTQAEIDAIYLADSAVILNGPYATQTITPATLPATISGAVKPDGINGYPIVLVQAESGGAWRAIATAESETGYSEFSKQTKVNDFRLYAKGYNTYEPVTAYFDDLDGGEDPGDFTIGIVEVAKNKRKALENLVLVHKPLHSWAVMVVKYI